MTRTTQTTAQTMSAVVLAMAMTLTGSIAGLSGCKAKETTGSPSASGSSSSSRTGATRQPANMEDPATAAKLEAEFVIGPEAARELDMRVDWQNLQAGKGLQNVWVQGDSVFTRDGQNLLSRILLKGGARLWRVAVTDATEEIHGLNFIADHVYVTTGGAVFVLDANTGALVGKQKLEKVANTQPVVFDRYLIYGSANGQAIWHAFGVGYQWRGYQVAHAIDISPVLNGRRLTMVGRDGTVMTLNASDASQYWSKKLLSAVESQPAIGQDAVYVAGTDQYVWAFDINDGRTIWRTLTESSLTDGPVLIGDFLYQQVPSQGLVCFEAMPLDSPGGKTVWTVPGQAGNVVMRRRDQLYVWDGTAKKLTILEAQRGGLVKIIDLSKVKFLVIPDITGTNSEIIAADNDGRVVHLVPRN